PLFDGRRPGLSRLRRRGPAAARQRGGVSSPPSSHGRRPRRPTRRSHAPTEPASVQNRVALAARHNRYVALSNPCYRITRLLELCPRTPRHGTIDAGGAFNSAGRGSDGLAPPALPQTTSRDRSKRVA